MVDGGTICFYLTSTYLSCERYPSNWRQEDFTEMANFPRIKGFAMRSLAAYREQCAISSPMSQAFLSESLSDSETFRHDLIKVQLVRPDFFPLLCSMQ